MAHGNGDRKNQPLYREVNKRIREVSGSLGLDGVAFVCECGREECTGTVEMTHAQFDGLLSGPDRMLLAAEHDTSANGRRIVAEYDTFLVLAAEAETASAQHSGGAGSLSAPNPKGVSMGTDRGVQAAKYARNQALCREVNERIRSLADTAGGLEFLCECANLDCTETLTLSLAEYESIRSSPVRFPVALGHVYPQVEDVVEHNERYLIVQKRGEAADVSASLDPRSRGAV